MNGDTALRLVGLALAIAGSVEIGCRGAETSDHPAEAGRQAGDAAATQGAVTALGRLQPGRSVIAISGTPGVRIERLFVKEGQKVEAGQKLAYLETHALCLAERDAASATLGETEARLKAETRHAEATIEQARANVRLLETQVAQARRDTERLASLRTGEAVSEQAYEDQVLLQRSRELSLERARAELLTAETGLVRAQSLVGVESARQALEAAQARLDQSIIGAPIGGRILRIFTYPGEAIGSDPILKMGDTDNMYAVAEVDELDVGRVRVGQPALVTSPSLDRDLPGKVEEIGWMIHKNDVLNIDPRADADTRIVEVRVRLDDSAPVVHLSQMEVSVRIDTSAPTAENATTPTAER